MSKSAESVKQMPEMRKKPKIHSFKLLGRLLSYLFHYYKGRMIAVFICIAVTAASGISSSVFLTLVIDKIITPLAHGTPYEELRMTLFYIIGGMGLMYIVALCASVFYNQTMAIVTQGFCVTCATTCSPKCRRFRSAISIRIPTATSCPFIPTTRTRCAS